jgi:hypothetical protein
MYYEQIRAMSPLAMTFRDHQAVTPSLCHQLQMLMVGLLRSVIFPSKVLQLVSPIISLFSILERICICLESPCHQQSHRNKVASYATSRKIADSF